MHPEVSTIWERQAICRCHTSVPVRKNPVVWRDCDMSRIAYQKLCLRTLNTKVLRFIFVVSQKCDGHIDAIA